MIRIDGAIHCFRRCRRRLNRETLYDIRHNLSVLETLPEKLPEPIWIRIRQIVVAQNITAALCQTAAISPSRSRFSLAAFLSSLSVFLMSRRSGGCSIPNLVLSSSTSVSSSSSQYTLMTSWLRSPLLNAQGRWVLQNLCLSFGFSRATAKRLRPVMGNKVFANSKALRATSPSTTTGSPVRAW